MIANIANSTKVEVKGDTKFIEIRIRSINDINLKRKRNRGIRDKTRRYQSMSLARVNTEDALNGNVPFRRIIKNKRTGIRTKKITDSSGPKTEETKEKRSFLIEEMERS